MIVDLATGETISAEIEQNGFGFSAVWAPDSTGLFLTGGPEGGLAFLDRASGDVVPFAEELGQITSIAVRYPETELYEQPVDADAISFSVDPVADVGIDVVTLGQLGVMTHLDLDEASATGWETPGLPTRAVSLFSDADTVLAVSGNGSSAFTSRFGRATELDADTLPPPPFLPGPTDGTMWAQSPDEALDVNSRLFSLDGTPLDNGASVTVGDASLLGSDSSGGLLIETGGDVYVSSGGDAAGFITGLSRLTTGEVLAVGERHAIVRECDAVRTCTTSKLDRATGELTPITGSAIVDADAIDDERDASLIGSMSPDGDVVLAQFETVRADGAEAVVKWALFDLGAGTATNVAQPSEGQPLIWNDDSSYAVFVADDALFVYERSTASVISVDAATEVRGLTEVDENFDTR